MCLSALRAALGAAAIAAAAAGASNSHSAAATRTATRSHVTSTPTRSPSYSGPPPTRVVCVGDSITAGTCSDDGGYPALLQARLGHGYVVFNEGVHGTTMQRRGRCSGGSVEGSCSYWHTAQHARALACSPDIVVVEFGQNDAKYINWADGGEADFTSDYEELIAAFEALPSKPQVRTRV